MSTRTMWIVIVALAIFLFLCWKGTHSPAPAQGG